MFATAMPYFDALAATQLIPQMICAQVPDPCASRTLTGKISVPGATPTTPAPLFLAAMVPDTCVPCPLLSSGAVPGLMQFVPLRVWLCATLRSGWSRSTPVSITATAAELAGFACAGVVDAAPMRAMPVGTDSPDASVSVA